MKKKELEKKIWRIGFAALHWLLLELVLGAERFAYFRRDYVFRGWLPALLPASAALACAGLAAALVFAFLKKGRARLFSPAFLAYLLAGLAAVLLIPWLAMNGSALHLFSLAQALLHLLLAGCFFGYAASVLCAPKNAPLAALFTGGVLAIALQYRFYYVPASVILMRTAWSEMPAWRSALLLAAFAAALALLAFLAGRFCARLRLPLWQLLCPPLLTAAALAVMAAAPAAAQYIYFAAALLALSAFAGFSFFNKRLT